jgi:acetylornithine deacetylase
MSSQSIAFGDAVALTEALVAIDSRNPALAGDAPGEGQIASLLASVLADWGFVVELVEPLPGRPSVVARAGTGGGRSLMLNGHLDTVDVEGMTHPPFEPRRHGGMLFGRGASDMKSGVASMCAAAARAAADGLAGEVIIAAVCDEEWASAGTQGLVDAGIVADAAIVCEPTRLAVMPAHKGFVWLDVDVHGRAAHGSRWELGVDAIRHAGLLLAELHEFDATGLASRHHPLLGRPSLHASTISGGTGMSTYPELCTLTIERRTLPGETPERVMDELAHSFERVGELQPDFNATARVRLGRAPSDVPTGAPIVVALMAACERLAHRPAVEGMSAWTDAAILNAAGIPAICFGPGDIALAHAAEEYVMIEEIERATAIMEALVRDWCNVRR